MIKSILIIKAGETLPHVSKRRGDFEDWIMAPLDKTHSTFSVVAAYKENLPSNPSDFSGIIITGSHAMVTDREVWSEQIAAWIPRVIESGVPLLGICYGHQLLAHAMGGVVGSFPAGVEMGTIQITLADEAGQDPLFKGMPTCIKAHASHSQSVLQLPPGATHLAYGDNDPHHAFAMGSCAWGVQFHPEFDADIMRAYVTEFSPQLNHFGYDPNAIKQMIAETPLSRQILVRFAKIVKSHKISCRIQE